MKSFISIIVWSLLLTIAIVLTVAIVLTIAIAFGYSLLAAIC